MNPVSLVEPPSQNEISVEKRVPSPDQVGALIAASKGDVWEVPILLSATTGARRSEVLGARWADVDLDAGVLRVTRGLHWIPIEGGKRELRFLDPKSDKARRSVPLLPVVAERLRQHRTEQLQRRMKAGSAWHDSDLVCDRGDGRAMDPDAMTKAFKRLARKAGLHPSTRLHDLRHAVITYLGQKGLHPKIVSTIAGHSDPAFTMRVYQRAWDEGVDEARMALGGVFGL
jgi:integrase